MYTIDIYMPVMYITAVKDISDIRTKNMTIQGYPQPLDPLEVEKRLLELNNRRRQQRLQKITKHKLAAYVRETPVQVSRAFQGKAPRVLLKIERRLRILEGRND